MILFLLRFLFGRWFQQKEKKEEIKFIGTSGTIWMTGQNNPVGKEAQIPYLYEQANVLNTLLKNINNL